MHSKLRNEIRGKSAPRVLDNRAKICAVSACAAATHWRGRAGATDHRVLEALLDVADRCGQLVFTASARQIASMTGYRRETVERSIRRLANARWIAMLERGRRDRASTIEILLTCLTNAPLQNGHCTYNNNNSVASFNGAFAGQLVRSAHPDTFRNGALPPSALDIFVQLSPAPSEPSTVAGLRAATGKARSTIYTCLMALEEAALAFRIAGGWFRLDGPFDALREKQFRVARDVFGSAGETERQAERYEQERYVYQQYCSLIDQGSREYILGEDERYAALPEDQQVYATDLAMRAAEHIVDLRLPPCSFADLRRRAFRLVVTASSPPVNAHRKRQHL